MKKYLVMSILKDDEWLELSTTNMNEAIDRALDEAYYNLVDNKGKYTIEIRVIDADEDEEEYSDYELLNWREK